MFDDPACYGAFEEVEKACREIGLTYVRASEAKYENDPVVVWWQPGMGEPRAQLATQAGEPTIKVHEVREAMGQGIPNLASLLDAATPPPIPPLQRSEA